MANVLLYYGDELGRYGFPEGHPFGCDRQGAFWQEARRQRLHDAATLRAPRLATREELERFHDTEYVDKVERMSQDGKGYLDYGDTPAFPGCYEAAAYVVGTALDGLERVMAGECRRSFQPIGGLHHARREAAAGFCVFSDLGVLIETLRARYGVRRIAYVDIDVHHGDGVFYAYEDDPDLIFADLHEDGNYLYPGTGHAHETGSGAARDTKLNIPMAPGAGDAQFLDAWAQAEAYLRRMKTEFFLFQCGADSVAGDPLAHLRYSPAAHAHAAKRLCALANETAQGHIMAFGGGGYHRGNLAKAWNGVLREMLDAE
ncbi:MAG TPA: acetoin utilization protein AcuC [Burkholderiales bacterium]|nr:acetoin utilization protein AcuC [Burkholderiales bacterium]